MSFARQVYFAAILAAWAALFGWLGCEFVILPLARGAAWEAIPSAGILGAAIGAGVGLAAGLSSGGGSRAFRRAGVGALGGFAGGIIGGLLGQLLFRFGLPQWLGWMVIGVAIGAADGVSARDLLRLRNGLIGGLLGGLVGGIAFRVLTSSVGGTGMAARAIGFVAIGLAIGALIGLVQVLLRKAWISVVDGIGVGRQLVLSGESTVLGASSSAALLIGGSDVEPEHATLIRTSNGYDLENHDQRIGTQLNGRLVSTRMPLANGDMIRIGSTFLRFNMPAAGNTTEEAEGPLTRPAILPPPAPRVQTPPRVPPATRTERPPPAPPAPVRPTPASPPKPVAPRETKPTPSILCPECGDRVETARGVCPHCGAMY